MGISKTKLKCFNLLCKKCHDTSIIMNAQTGRNSKYLTNNYKEIFANNFSLEIVLMDKQKNANSFINICCNLGGNALLLIILNMPSKNMSNLMLLA